MSATSSTGHRFDLERGFRLGDAMVWPLRSCIEVGGERRRVEHKAMQVLLALARRPGREVAKRSIFDQVWAGESVSDDVLTGAVSALRRALGDDARAPHTIQTIPRVGYRLIAEVQALEAAPAGTARWPPGWRLAALALAVAVAAGWWALRGSRPAAPVADSAAVRSLAVLPLANFTGDAGQEHLADGMTEALIAALARAPAVRVISRTSSMRYKDTDVALPAIGRELDVETVVEGSVQRQGDRLRVTVQLLDTARDAHLWAASFDGSVRAVLALQRRVADAIVAQLGVAAGGLPPAADAMLAPAAYEAFLRGRYHAREVDDPAAQQRAIADLTRAVAAAPGFADAHVALAECWLRLVEAGAVAVAEGIEAARTPAARALALDPSSARAETLLGAVALLYDWDFEAAEARLRRGLALDPSDAVAHDWLARYLIAMRRFDEALVEVGWVRRLDPKAYSRPHMARILYLMGRYDEALEELDAQLEVEPASAVLIGLRVLVLHAAGRFDQAVAVYLHALALEGSDSEARQLEQRYREQGLAGIFRYYLTSTEPPAADALGSAAVSYAELLIGAGEVEHGLDWLERAVERREPAVVTLGVYRFFSGLHHHPRFQALLRRVGLPA